MKKFLTTLSVLSAFSSFSINAIESESLLTCLAVDPIWSDCEGTSLLTNGSSYSGDWKNNEMHGKGVYNHTNGDIYVGEFKFGKANGQGTVTFSDGAMYVGGFKDGKKDGQGVFTYSDGSKYVGRFNKGEAVHGTKTYSISALILKFGLPILALLAFIYCRNRSRENG